MRSLKQLGLIFLSHFLSYITPLLLHRQHSSGLLDDFCQLCDELLVL